MEIEMKKPEKCPKCGSEKIRILPLERYEPSVYDPDSEHAHPFRVHYAVECLVCFERVELGQ